jgi:hypothetical protein
LESAKYKILSSKEDVKQAHGGFGTKKNEANIASGLGNENITGIMPLYLFDEHFKISKIKIQPVFGFMTTLDIMGYSSE